MHRGTLRKEMNILRIGIKEIHRLQHWVLPVAIINAIFKAVTPFINIFMSARIIDILLGSKNIHDLIYMVLLTICINLTIYGISTGLDHLYKLLRSIMDQNLNMNLNEKIINMDYENIENTEVHNLRNKIADSKKMNGGGINALLFYFGDFVKSFATVITSIVLMINLFSSSINKGNHISIINSKMFSYGFLIIILIGTMLSMKLKTKSDKEFFAHYGMIMDTNRLFSYYFDAILDYNLGKEIRLCNEKEMLCKEMHHFHNITKKMFNDLGIINAKYNGFEALIASLLSGLIYIFVGLKAISGVITIGSIVQYAGSINQFMNGSKEFITSINTIINNNQYLQLYIDFLNIKNEKYNGTLPVEKRDDDEYELEFKNVSFKYPGTDTYTLKDVSIKLNIGERLAIVGMNGSGKTTFIKLLCRLYDPDEGYILLNGIDIKKYSYEEYMRLFSIVFQDFKLFSYSLGQNVAASVNFKEESIKDVLNKVGLEERLDSMPKGINTPLYKDFDEEGVEISGGEAQKVALARALYRNAPIIILDEPTAALDPISEFEIYSKFNEIVGTKTAFYISHRLSSCRFCDEIAVFNDGQIIQKGTHEELLKDKSGKYFELWNSQAKYYNSEESA